MLPAYAGLMAQNDLVVLGIPDMNGGATSLEAQQLMLKLRAQASYSSLRCCTRMLAEWPSTSLWSKTISICLHVQRHSQRASIAEPQGSDNIQELASYLQQCCPSTPAYWPRTTFWSQRPDRAKSTATRVRFARMREVMRTRPTSRNNGWPYGRTPGSGAANTAESQGAETVLRLATRRHK